MVSIIGDDISQLVPVMYAYRRECREHWLVCDRAVHDQAQRLARGLARLSERYQLAWQVTIRTIDAADPSAGAAHVTTALGEMGDVWFHATDAPPMFALMFGRAVAEGGGRILSYDHESNTLCRLDASGEAVETSVLHESLNLHDFLTLLNYRIASQSTRTDLAPRRKKVEALYRHASRFRQLRYALLYPQQNRNFPFGSHRDLLAILSELGIVKGEHLIPSRQKELSGDLFEEHVFWTVEALGVDDIALGVTIDFDDPAAEPTAQYRVYNEFDILLMHANRIYTIECKFSTHVDGLELVYKYDAIIDYFGQATRAILLNISSKPKEPYLGMRRSANFPHSTLRRAHRSNIHVHHASRFDPEKFQAAVRSFFHIGGDDDL